MKYFQKIKKKKKKKKIEKKRHRTYYVVSLSAFGLLKVRWISTLKNPYVIMHICNVNSVSLLDAEAPYSKRNGETRLVRT